MPLMIRLRCSAESSNETASMRRGFEMSILYVWGCPWDFLFWVFLILMFWASGDASENYGGVMAGAGLDSDRELSSAEVFPSKASKWNVQLKSPKRRRTALDQASL